MTDNLNPPTTAQGVTPELKPSQYRKKPVVIEAVQCRDDNRAEFSAFLRDGGAVWQWGPDSWPIIQTLESNFHTVSEGDFIIKGIKGEFYACKPDIFVLTHEALAAPSSAPQEPVALVETIRGALQELHSAIDEKMGDSELPDDESRLMLAMQRAAGIIWGNHAPSSAPPTLPA